MLYKCPSAHTCCEVVLSLHCDTLLTPDCQHLAVTDYCASADGVKRRKVMQTVINDKGEEVTEEVWEDSQQASPQPENAPKAASEQPQASPSEPSPAKASQDDALKEQPGQFGEPGLLFAAAPHMAGDSDIACIEAYLSQTCAVLLLLQKGTWTILTWKWHRFTSDAGIGIATAPEHVCTRPLSMQTLL